MYTLVTLSILFAVTVMAAPDAVYQRQPMKRDTASSTTPVKLHVATPLAEPGERAGVYICEHINWGGKCEYRMSLLGSAPDNCVELDGSTSSVGPDEGYYCVFYENAFCRTLASDLTDTLDVGFPGETNLLETYAGNWNDRIRSYHCFKDDGVLRNSLGDADCRFC